MLRWGGMDRASRVQFVALVLVTAGSMVIIVVGLLVAAPGNRASSPTGTPVAAAVASPSGVSGTPPPSP